MPRDQMWSRGFPVFVGTVPSVLQAAGLHRYRRRNPSWRATDDLEPEDEEARHLWQTSSSQNATLSPTALGVHLLHSRKGGIQMLWTIAVILFVLWALGLATAYTLSGFIHVLLLLAIVVVLIQVIQGRRPVL